MNCRQQRWHVVVTDPFRPGTSFLHQLDARIKLVLALYLLVIINLTPVQAWPAQAAYLAILVLATLRAGLPLGRLLRGSLVGAPFLGVAALGVLLAPQGPALLSLPVRGGLVLLTQGAALRLASVLCHGWLSALVAVLLAQTTSFVQLGHALAALGLPRALVEIVLFTYRYVFVLAGEAQQLLRARTARTAAGGASVSTLLAWRARMAGALVGTLFLRALERSERIHGAMLARGYDGAMPLLTRPSVSRHALRVAILGGVLPGLVAGLATWFTHRTGGL